MEELLCRYNMQAIHLEEPFERVVEHLDVMDKIVGELSFKREALLTQLKEKQEEIRKLKGNREELVMKLTELELNLPDPSTLQLEEKVLQRLEERELLIKTVKECEISIAIDRDLDTLEKAIEEGNIPSAEEYIRKLDDNMTELDSARIQRFKTLKKGYVRIVKDQLMAKGK